MSIVTANGNPVFPSPANEMSIEDMRELSDKVLDAVNSSRFGELIESAKTALDAKENFETGMTSIEMVKNILSANIFRAIMNAYSVSKELLNLPGAASLIAGKALSLISDEVLEKVETALTSSFTEGVNALMKAVSVMQPEISASILEIKDAKDEKELAGKIDNVFAKYEAKLESILDAKARLLIKSEVEEDLNAAQNQG